MVSPNVRYFLSILLICVGFATLLMWNYGRSLWVPTYQKLAGKDTVADIQRKYGESAETRLRPKFLRANVAYPPEKITLLALKDSKILELWAEQNGQQHFVHQYRIKATSGYAGPKLREGDRQVPEGIYKLDYLNPNSAYHLSMKLNYPNEFDLKYAGIEGRDQPGSNIFIHGKALSIGCLAMGDKAIEELFILVSDIGIKNVEVAIAPSDPRINNIVLLSNDQPDWVALLYEKITDYFHRYRLP